VYGHYHTYKYTLDTNQLSILEELINSLWRVRTHDNIVDNFGILQYR